MDLEAMFNAEAKKGYKKLAKKWQKGESSSDDEVGPAIPDSMKPKQKYLGEQPKKLRKEEEKDRQEKQRELFDKFNG